MYSGQEKYLFINLNMNQLTMIIETGHRSSILILGSSACVVHFRVITVHLGDDAPCKIVGMGKLKIKQ
jgi:hypothetical protein